MIRKSKGNSGLHEYWIQRFVIGVLLSSLNAFPSNAAPCAGAESQLLSATKLFEQGSLLEAERMFSEIQAAHPFCEEVLLGLGRVRAAQGDSYSAQKLLSLYTELAPKDAKGFYYLASLLFSQSDYRRAETLLQRAASLNPDHADTLILQARILVMTGQTTVAQEVLEKACKLAPDNAEAHFQMGSLFDRNKRHAEAAAQFEMVIALNPRDPRAYDYLALNLEPLGEIERAEAAYKKGLQVNEGPLFDTFLDYNYGRFLLKRNRLPESKKHLDRALQLAPQTRAVHYEHGKLNLRLQNYQEARIDGEQALSLADPSNVILDLQVYYLLSTVYTRLGEKALAQKYFDLSRTTPVPIQARERK